MTSFKHFTISAILSTLIISACAGTQTSTTIPVENQETQASIQEPDPEPIQFEAVTTPMNLESLIAEVKDNTNANAAFTLGLLFLDDVPEVRSIKTDNITTREEAFRNFYNASIESAWLEDFRSSPYTDTSIENLDYDRIFDPSIKEIKLIEESAARGHGNAEHLIGLLHYYGIHQNADKKKGIEFITRAAMHGIAQAQYMVGMFYELGLDRPVDKKKALQWLNKAYLNHSADAAFVLYIKYIDGIDVPKDPQKAKDILKEYWNKHAWLALADYDRKFGRVCSYNYDHVTTLDAFEDNCGGESDYEWDENLSEEDNLKQMELLNMSKKERFSHDFAVNYQLAHQWLYTVVNQSNAANAKFLISQTLVNGGCRGAVSNDVDDEKTAENYLFDLKKQNFNDIDYHIATFYDALHSAYSDSERDLYDLAEKSFKYYKLAADAGNSDACSKVSELYLYDPDARYSIREHLTIETDPILAFQYLEKGKGLEYQKADTAAVIAYRFRTFQHDDDNAFEWYLKACQYYENAIKDGNYFGNGENLVETYFNIGELYSNPNSKHYDLNKTIEYYNKIYDLDSKMLFGEYTPTFSNYTHMLKAAKQAMSIYQNGEGPIAANADLALEWNKRILENAQTSSAETEPEDATPYRQQLDKLPKLSGLKSAIFDEIKKESGKNISEFFVIKSGLNPCLEDAEKCSDRVNQYYLESIQKSLTAITALTLVQRGKLDLEIIENTIYDIAIIQARNIDNQKSIFMKSVVFEAITSQRFDYNISNTIYLQLMYTWYLRQIPYAAKAVFEKSANAKSWDEYIKQAEIEIQQNEKLKTLFGYDLLRPIQKMHR